MTGRLSKLLPLAASIIAIARATPSLAVNNMTDHGGPVMTNPKLYIVYWGIDWYTFKDPTSGLSSGKYQTYLEDFLNGIGGGPWLSSQKQYGNAGCSQGVIAGTWIDSTNALPTTPTQGQIEEEVRRAAEYFNTSSTPQTVYLIALPPGHGDTQFVNKTACAWHSAAWNNNIINVRFYSYITLPYIPDSAGKTCSTNAVNNGFDSSGHGIFDGVSKVAGHEWAEVLTDPLATRIKFAGGWMDDNWDDIKHDGGETGDKCNTSQASNIAASGGYFAVQPLWSNADGGCVLNGTPSADQSPANENMGGVVRYTTSFSHTIQLTNNGDLDLPLDLINNSPWYLTGPNVSDFSLGSNTCGKFLPPGNTCQVQVYFRPLEIGTRQATLAVRVPFGVSHTGNTTALMGVGASQWAAFDQTVVIFGGYFVHSTNSDPVIVNLGNQGSAAQFIQGVMIQDQVPPEFLILRDGCSGHLLAPSASCPIALSFMPQVTGERQTDLQVMDAAGGVFGIPVSGTGLGPIGQLSASELVFDEIKYSSDAAAPAGQIPVSGETQKQVTLTNSGQSPLTVNGIEVEGDFVAQGNDCVRPLLPGEFCTMFVGMAPTHLSGQSGRILIYDDTSDSPHQVSLRGSVESAVASFVADSLTLDPVPVGVRSGPKTVEFENLEGDAPLQITSISATGDFAATSDCPALLSLGRCTISVSMTPTAAGSRRGMLVVNDNAPGSPHQIPLVGKACGADPDCDEDGIPDTVDRCPYYTSTNQSDTDGNGRGDVCECGDQDGNGRVNVSDLVAINIAIFNPALVTPLCDTNNDGVCNVLDIIGANRTIYVPRASTCSRQPVPGP